MVLKHAVLASVVSSFLLISGGVRAQAPQAQDAPAADGATATGSLDKSKTDAKLKKSAPANETATFGGGCFWHVEAVFDRMKGVKSAVSGYAGGSVAFPSYEMVHTGTTGHVEVVQVTYDPKILSYEDLLKTFWACHDPTSVDRQGPDEGPQYRSVIFYSNEDQRKAALKSYQDLTDARAFRGPIVTRLLPLKAFYEAEAYHQDYYGGKPRAYARKHAAAKTKKSSVSAKKAAAQKGKTASRTTAKPDAPSVGDPEPPAQH